MKRILFYVHYNKFDQLSSHVVYQLEHIKFLFDEVIFISNSVIKSQDYSYLIDNKLITNFIQRENRGYDFVAWKEGLDTFGWKNVKEFDSITLMNDTCFGPLWDLTTYYNTYESDKGVDFWGMTNHRKTSRFKEHLQSYFISFKNQVIISEHFQKFWNSVEEYDKVQEVIDNLESSLTNIFLNSGFKYKAIFDTKNEDISYMALPDFSYYNISKILENKVPFIKIKAIDGNHQQSVFIINEIERVTNYPKKLIIEHMSNMFLPTSNYLLQYKYMDDENETVILDNKKIAIHLHVFYVDLLDTFLDTFKTFPFSFDLYITTNNDEKSEEIKRILKNYTFNSNIKITGNRGRDILPMLKLKENLSQYDFVGHFHTKRSKEAEFWAGESWRRELIEMLVKNSPQIISKMVQRKEVGIVIADVPTYFRFVPLDPFYENDLGNDMNLLWEKMKLKKSIDFEEFSNFVMSYGTFIWFKYDALSPLFDLNLKDEDVPAEPLPKSTILHSIERMLVYISWSRGYDFLISKNPLILPPFVDINLLNKKDNLNFSPASVIDFTYYGGIKGALKYFVSANIQILKYIVKKILSKFKGNL